MKRYRTPSSNRTIGFCIAFLLVIALLILVGLPVQISEERRIDFGLTGRAL